MSIAAWIRQRKLKKIWRNPPQIWTYVDGQRETVSEGARRQAAANLSVDPVKLAQVIELIGEAETRRRYPEVYVE